MKTAAYNVRHGFVFVDTTGVHPRAYRGGETVQVASAVGAAAHQLERVIAAPSRVRLTTKSKLQGGNDGDE
jgi:hypothetical protein